MEVNLVQARRLEERPTWSRGVNFALLCAYAAGFLLATLAAGPWQATRDFAAEGLILFLWLFVAWRFLKGQPDIEVPVQRPRRELILGLSAFPLMVAGASFYYLGQPLLIFFTLAILYALPLVVLMRYPHRRLALGLRWPTKRAWLALMAIVLINSVVGITVGNLLPEGEMPTPPGADLAEELTSIQLVLIALGQLTITAAIPEELFFRIYLLPRLNRFLPIGWAILTQAILFSTVHLPQGLILYGESWLITLAGVFTIANGVIGGYLWYRTRSLPLLVLVHLFAYPRIGL